MPPASRAHSAGRLLREKLRQKGQFWTPAWVAEAMVAYVLRDGARCLFDPAVGAGAFFLAAQALAGRIGRVIECCGVELEPSTLELAAARGVGADALARVHIGDFLELAPRLPPAQAIVANPPYVRHHRLPPTTKTLLRCTAAQVLGEPLDGRAGLHVYFLIWALRLLGKGGRLCFLVSADTCEGVFAPALWRWITAQYRLDAVLTFAPEASPFPDLDTNPIVIMIRNSPPSETFVWARCTSPGNAQLVPWVLRDFDPTEAKGLEVQLRTLSEGLRTGLSRRPSSLVDPGVRLGDFARVMRGIATGCNSFFHLTKRQAAALNIPEEFLVPAIARTRDLDGPEVTAGTLEALEKAERPTLLFSPDGRPLGDFPPSVQAYILHGEAIGVAQKPLIATRRPWYRMERRSAPPILFAYLGRRNLRFVRNRAGVVPLTGFLCVYPRLEEEFWVDALWQVLRHPATNANLALVAKSYGNGALKVEPRALENLPLPTAVVRSAGLPWERRGNTTVP